MLYDLVKNYIVTFLLLFLLYSWCSADSNEPVRPNSPDVNDISIQGDSTLMGMKIESSYFADGAFLVETTGARFEYVKGELKLYQGLDAVNRRLLSTITFENEPNFIKVESNEDHVLFQSENINIGIYGDSTLIVFPKRNQNLKCLGNFKPDYEGRYKGELLLIDDKGGMEIYPQRYEAGYDIEKIELGRQDWTADYKLNAGERVMIAAFPGRTFDWEKSFNSNIIVTCGSMGRGTGNPYGQMPADSTIQQWSSTFKIVVMFYFGLYTNAVPQGPYLVANVAEFRRFIAACHNNKMQAAAYASLFYWRHHHPKEEDDQFYDQIRSLKDIYGIDGIYVDGLTFDSGIYKTDDKIANWEMVRRLRQFFGPAGVVVCHNTNIGTPVATIPNVDSYCDAVVTGENVAFNDLNEPYINYQVRKYGISNTQGIWYIGTHPEQITRRQIIDKVIAMNGREWWGAFVNVKNLPPNNTYVWPANINNGTEFPYYLQSLENLKQMYNAGQK